MSHSYTRPTSAADDSCRFRPPQPIPATPSAARRRYPLFGAALGRPAPPPLAARLRRPWPPGSATLGRPAPPPLAARLRRPPPLAARLRRPAPPTAADSGPLRRPPSAAQGGFRKPVCILKRSDA